jgi:hypothetical protein
MGVHQSDVEVFAHVLTGGRRGLTPVEALVKWLERTGRRAAVAIRSVPVVALRTKDSPVSAHVRTAPADDLIAIDAEASVGVTVDLKVGGDVAEDADDFAVDFHRRDAACSVGAVETHALPLVANAGLSLERVPLIAPHAVAFQFSCACHHLLDFSAARDVSAAPDDSLPDIADQADRQNIAVSATFHEAAAEEAAGVEDVRDGDGLAFFAVGAVVTILAVGHVVLALFADIGVDGRGDECAFGTLSETDDSILRDFYVES